MQREIVHWINMFKACWVTALAMIPDDLYGYMRSRGLIDIEHDVTPLGERFVARHG